MKKNYKCTQVCVCVARACVHVRACVFTRVRCVYETREKGKEREWERVVGRMEGSRVTETI